MKTDVSDCISRPHQTKFGSTSLPCDITKASVLLFHDTTPQSSNIGRLFWKSRLRFRLLDDFYYLTSIETVFGQVISQYLHYFPDAAFNVFPKVQELTLCKDKTSAISWVPVPQTSSLRREADGLTKMLQVKNVSKSHHLSCWTKIAVGNVLYATLCLLRRSQLSIYFLKSDPKAFLLQPAASQGPHLWQIISWCGRKVGTNLANPIWDQ